MPDVFGFDLNNPQEMKNTKEKIKVMQAFLDGIECQGEHIESGDLFDLNDPNWDWATYDYHIKPEHNEISREEITSQWVKENDLKVGGYVRVKHDKPFMSKGMIHQVIEIGSYYIRCESFGGLFDFSVEDIEKATKKVVKFDLQDYEKFIGKTIKYKNGIIAIITSCTSHAVGTSGNFIEYENALETIEFICGSPFGKEVWE